MATGFIAYFLDNETAQSLALAGGEPPEELHITVAFLPNITPDQSAKVQELLLGLTEVYGPMEATVNGMGRFFINGTNADGSKGRDVLLLMPDVVGLAEMRIRLLDVLDAEGIEYAVNHGYQPHITLKYLEEGEVIELGEGENLSFPLNRLTFVYKDDEDQKTRIDYPHIGDKVFMKVKTTKVGARNNRMDSRNIQDIHDLSTKLGAMCMEEDPVKNFQWSEMDFESRSNAIREAFYRGSVPDEIKYDLYVAQVFDDHFLACSYDGKIVYKYHYSVLNDKEVAIANEGVKGKLKFIPDEEEEEDDNNMPAPNPFRSITLTPDQARKSITLALAKGVTGANNLKTLELTDDTWRVGNYMVLWGGRDLTGEHFTPETKFESEYTNTDTLIEDWEHGLWPDKVGPTVDEPLGKVLWKTTSVLDDVGIFVERVLNRQNKYVEALRQLEEEGLLVLGSSSEAVPNLVQKTDDGQIKQWGLKRDAITVTPAEPRMLDVNKIASVKNMGDGIITFLKSIYEKAGYTEEPERSGSDASLQRLRLKRKTLTL